MIERWKGRSKRTQWCKRKRCILLPGWRKVGRGAQHRWCPGGQGQLRLSLLRAGQRAMRRLEVYIHPTWMGGTNPKPKEWWRDELAEKPASNEAFSSVSL